MIKTIQWHKSLVEASYTIAAEIWHLDREELATGAVRNKSIWDAQRVIYSYMNKSIGVSFYNLAKVVGTPARTIQNRIHDYNTYVDSDAYFRNQDKVFRERMDAVLDIRVNLLHEINELRSEMYLKLNELQDRMTP